MFKIGIIYFVVQSNSEEIIDNSSVNSSTKAGEYFGGL